MTTKAARGKFADVPMPAAAVAAQDDTASRRRALGLWRAFWPYLAAHKPMLAATVAALVVAVAAVLAVPMGVRRMIDFGFGAADPALIDSYFAMMVVIGLMLALATAARFYCVSWLGERVVADLRADVFAHLARLSPAFFETTHSGEVMSRLTADTTQIKAVVGAMASQALRNLALLAGSVVMMVVTSPWLSAMTLAAIPIIVLPLVAYGRLVRRLSRAAQDTLADASAYAGENLAAVRTLQAFTHERAAAARFSDAVERAFDAATARVRARAMLTALAIFLVFASVVGVLWYGAQGVLSGELSAGRLSQFVLYAVFAAAAMGSLSEVWGEVQQAAGAAERLAELLAVRSTVQSPPDPEPLPEPAQGRIEFDAVSFRYPARAELAALKNVSLTVAPGETVAIVGPSGAGKSTIFALLLRFYDPQSGRVRVDGVSVDRADLSALRRRMALVPQEMALFADTIADNIRYGAGEAGDRAVRAAAKAAFAHDFIMALPDGYDTRLGEQGVTLSAGQRQRIAIARAILRDAPILLLDEATSALDAESEHAVRAALDRVMRGRTTLVIAHRLATVQRADRILVLQDGRIVEEGTHRTLLGRRGIYARLAELQLTDAAL